MNGHGEHSKHDEHGKHGEHDEHGKHGECVIRVRFSCYMGLLLVPQSKKEVMLDNLARA